MRFHYQLSDSLTMKKTNKEQYSIRWETMNDKQPSVTTEGWKQKVFNVHLKTQMLLKPSYPGTSTPKCDWWTSLVCVFLVDRHVVLHVKLFARGVCLTIIFETRSNQTSEGSGKTRMFWCLCLSRHEHRAVFLTLGQSLSPIVHLVAKVTPRSIWGQGCLFSCPREPRTLPSHIHKHVPYWPLTVI